MPDSPFILEKNCHWSIWLLTFQPWNVTQIYLLELMHSTSIWPHPSARTQITKVVQLVCWISHLLLPALEWSHWKPPWRENLPQTNAATDWQWRDFYYYSIITLGSVPKWAYFLPDAISFYPGSSLKVDQWE